MGDNSEGPEVIVLIPSSGLQWVRRSSNVLSRFLLELLMRFTSIPVKDQRRKFRLSFRSTWRWRKNLLRALSSFPSLLRKRLALPVFLTTTLLGRWTLAFQPQRNIRLRFGFECLTTFAPSRRHLLTLEPALHETSTKLWATFTLEFGRRMADCICVRHTWLLELLWVDIWCKRSKDLTAICIAKLSFVARRWCWMVFWRRRNVLDASHRSSTKTPSPPVTLPILWATSRTFWRAVMTWSSPSTVGLICLFILLFEKQRCSSNSASWTLCSAWTATVRSTLPFLASSCQRIVREELKDASSRRAGAFKSLVRWQLFENCLASFIRRWNGSFSEHCKVTNLKRRRPGSCDRLSVTRLSETCSRVCGRRRVWNGATPTIAWEQQASMLLKMQVSKTELCASWRGAKIPRAWKATAGRQRKKKEARQVYSTSAPDASSSSAEAMNGSLFIAGGNPVFNNLTINIEQKSWQSLFVWCWPALSLLISAVPTKKEANYHPIISYCQVVIRQN